MRALLLLALLALPLASAQGPQPEAPDETANPTRLVTIYPQVFSVGAGAPMPGNTQFPWGEDDFSRGSPTGCSDAWPEGQGVAVVVASMQNCEEGSVMYVYSTAGFVSANQDTWSYEQFHNERGQAKDVLLDPAQPITATFYMSADAHAWYPSVFVPERLQPGIPSGVPVWNWDPGVHPNWQVEATLYLMHLGEYQGQASEPPPVQEMMDSEGGILVAQGVSAAQTMLSLDSNLNSGQGEVYEFTIDLGVPQVDRIPKEMDWVMRFRWWSVNGQERFALPVSWNVNSGEFYPNRFTLPVRNPFDVELVYPQFLHDKLLIHAMLNSPWGSYDVDSRSVRIEVLDQANALVDMRTSSRVADFSVAHGGHYKPVNITWVWDHQADALRPGTYTVRVTATNFQHSASSTTEARFRINADGTGTVLEIGRSGQQTTTEAQRAALESPLGTQSGSPPRAVPGVEALALLALGAGLAAARRR